MGERRRRQTKNTKKERDVDEDAKNIFDAYKDDSNSTENMNSREIASKFLKRLKRLAEKRKLDELLQFLDDNAGFVATLKDDKKLCRAIASRPLQPQRNAETLRSR